MRCLNTYCRYGPIPRSTPICPECRVVISALMKEMLPFDWMLQKGRYQIDHPLGFGGFGVTYRAMHVGLDMIVAIKEFFPRDKAQRDHSNHRISAPTPQAEAFQRGLKRFTAEGRILASLSDPHVVRVQDWFEEHGTAYLVMDLIRGVTLRDELKAAGGPLPESRVRELTGQLVNALETIHEKGIYHLDIKPENLMVRKEDENVVLIDFGSARLEGLTSGTTQPFTPSYAPPEVIDCGSRADIDARSDLYELGMVLYELLTGKSPAGGLVKRDDSLLLDVPETWRPAVIEATRFYREERPQTVREWWEKFVKPRDVKIRPKPGPAHVPPAHARLSEFQFDAVAPNDDGQSFKILRKRAEQLVENLDGATLGMVRIPAGEFLMGSSERPSASGRLNEAGDRTERPQHLVRVKEFFIGKYEITQEQWERVARWPRVDRDINPYPSRSEGGRLPVENINWYEAKEFCARLSMRTKGRYRLPSEAEWEYACRAGTTTAFSFGETITPKLVKFNAGYESSRAKKDQPIPPDSLGAVNGFGLFDMHGNVWEWCEDVWHDNYGGAPDDGGAWVDGGDQDFRIQRGGSWDDDSVFCRSAYRKKLAPDVNHDNVGLRVVYCAAEG